jgi:outer membrane protein
MPRAKTAHVDVSDLMSKMPAMLDAQKQLEKLSGTYDTEYKTMVEEYQNKLKKYEQEASTVTEAVNETRSKEVQDMQKRIVDYRDNAQKKLQQKESDIVKPIMEKVKASIQKSEKPKDSIRFEFRRFITCRWLNIGRCQERPRILKSKNF